MFMCSSFLLFGAKNQSIFFSFYARKGYAYIVTGIVVFGYHNRKASKPIINTRVNTFLSGIVGFAGVYFCSKFHIMYIVQKCKKK